MKIKSDVIWAIVLLLVAIASFFLGVQRGSLSTEEELEEKLKEIEILKNKNQQLSEELTSRGIYSYPQANLVSKAQDASAMVLITLNGQDPIKNLKVRRKVIENYSQSKDYRASETGTSGRWTDLGTLKPHNPSAFEIPLNQQEVAIQLDYESGRNTWRQYIWLKRANDNKIQTFWIITNGNSQIIDKHIDPGFPKEAEDQITLWKDKKVEYSNLRMNSVFPPEG